MAGVNGRGSAAGRPDQRPYYRDLKIDGQVPMVHRATSKRAGRRSSDGARKGRMPIPLVLDADQFGGQWIATLKGHVVASGDDLVAVNKSLDAMGYGSDVILTKVPRRGDLVL